LKYKKLYAKALPLDKAVFSQQLTRIGKALCLKLAEGFCCFELTHLVRFFRDAVHPGGHGSRMT
jgi:hypothetical protein